jgi:hypothetical protein
MESAESVSHGELVMCSSGNEEFTARDIIDAAFFRGDVDLAWEQFLYRMAANERADELDLELNDDAFDAAAEQFRYNHDLITAEETEQWLGVRGLSLENFSEFFTRQQWGAAELEEVKPQAIEFEDAPADLRDTFTIDLILSGQLDWMTTVLSWRLAALAVDKEIAAELVEGRRKKFFERTSMDEKELAVWLEKLGRNAEWFDWQCTLGAAYQKRCAAVLVPNAAKRELSSLRLPLTKFEIEVMELESRDAAHEALFCVREDGMSMEEVATEGRYPFRRLEFILEDLAPEVQQKFLSVSAGQVLEPMEKSDGFDLCRVVRKIEPQENDPAIVSRIEQRLLDRHFAEITAKHVDLRLRPWTASE